MKSLLASNRRTFLLLLSVLVIFILGGLLTPVFRGRFLPSDKRNFPELEQLGKLSKPSFDELSNFFTQLAKEKRARYAFEILKAMPVFPNIDMHLLAHVVGDELFKQEGVKGIEICTEDFRNACSHSIVVGLFSEKGEAALPEIAAICLQAAGGSGAYTMCFHGLGHGILAWAGYELPKAVEICKKTGTIQHQNREAAECVGGAIMEMTGGVHDVRLRQEKSKIFLGNKGNSLYPCTSDFINKEISYMCYFYITPHLFELAGADLGSPQPEQFSKAFTFCETLPKNDKVSREACYGGLGKEFIGLILGRDIRKASIEGIRDDQLKQMYQWCLLTPNKEGSAACVLHIANSLYWGGENDRRLAIRFCSLIPDPYYGGSCFVNLIGAVGYYVQDAAYRRAFCEEIPDSFREECRMRLRV
ncbi:MAG: hypothetical protein HY001_03900 [Candidatus Portnoybacteria bacterium]|nr:hypothetical protein [Candidatus Portnoybacteria bacterium]